MNGLTVVPQEEISDMMVRLAQDEMSENMVSFDTPGRIL